jgi:hypothetical protein
MALDAKQLAVVGIVAESFHFLRTACRFDWHDVMAVHASPDDALLLAFFAQSFRSLPHDAFHFPPSLRVEQPLVSLVTAHRFIRLSG